MNERQYKKELEEKLSCNPYADADGLPMDDKLAEYWQRAEEIYQNWLDSVPKANKEEIIKANENLSRKMHS